MTRPVLFLDVDGVISCLTAADGEMTFVERGFPICVRPGLRERLSELDQLFEIVWCTSWFDHANEGLLPALGAEIGPFEVVRWGEMKLEAIPAAAAGRRWAWLDDEISFERAQLGERFEQLLAGEEHLLLEVEASRGLDEEAMEALRAFAAGERAE